MKLPVSILLIALVAVVAEQDLRALSCALLAGLAHRAGDQVVECLGHGYLPFTFLSSRAEPCEVGGGVCGRVGQPGGWA